MSDGFKLEIVNPEKSFLSKQSVSEVVVPAFEGDMGILKDHISIISFLKPGLLRVFEGSNEETYYVDVNDLIKPASLNNVDLKPQKFGLSGQYTLTNYVSSLKSSIRSRQDINGDLQDYLLDLVDYEMMGSGNLSGYNTTDLPMASIEKEFGEALGPIFV